MLQYAITDRALFDGSLDGLMDKIIAIAAHVDYLQIRERDLPAVELERFTSRVMAALALLPRRPLVLVNHRADVAMACGADGVHVRSASGGELTAQQVFEVYAKAGLPRPVVSASCHSLEQIESAVSASLILFGPVFEKRVPSAQSLPGRGLPMLEQACIAAHSVPVLALGGVTKSNQDECLRAGAAGIAGIRLFFAQ